MKINPVGAQHVQRAYGQQSQKPKSGFGEMLNGLLNDTNVLQTRAAAMSNAAIAGAPVEAHDVMIAAEEARLAFGLMLEVRNKLIESYRELMQMRM